MILDDVIICNRKKYLKETISFFMTNCNFFDKLAKRKMREKEALFGYEKELLFICINFPWGRLVR